jgi:phospholipid transport system substrate-binding protein
MKLTSLLITLLLVTLTVSAKIQTEESVIKETTATVLKQLNENRDRLKSEPQYIQQLVNELIIPHFDFELMSELVLGSYWQKFEKPQQTCFISGFRNLLVERYAYILLSYDDHEISYGASKYIGKKGYKLVSQTISREGAKPLPIGYAMQLAGDKWKVVDLIIDEISLIRGYSGMFQSWIHTQGRDYFISNFSECNE